MSVLVDQSMPFVQLMANGIPDVYKDSFWSLLTVAVIDHIFTVQLPTPSRVANKG